VATEVFLRRVLTGGTTRFVPADVARGRACRQTSGLARSARAIPSGPRSSWADRSAGSQLRGRRREPCRGSHREREPLPDLDEQRGDGGRLELAMDLRSDSRRVSRHSRAHECSRRPRGPPLITSGRHSGAAPITQSWPSVTGVDPKAHKQRRGIDHTGSRRTTHKCRAFCQRPLCRTGVSGRRRRNSGCPCPVLGIDSQPNAP